MPSTESIREAIYDRSQIARADSARWRLGPNAQIPQVPDEILSPITPKLERVSPLPEGDFTVIGGLCSIFTGDLALNDYRSAAELVRMDQIVETVGSVQGKDTLIVVEDSFFSALTGVSSTVFREQANEAVERINKWLSLTRQEPVQVSVVYTSDQRISRGLRDAVDAVAVELNNPNFNKLQAAPILLMYSSFWGELLQSTGFINTPYVLCVEPVNHFVDDRAFPDKKLQYAYEDFLGWMRDNPAGVSGSRNEMFGVAGFWDSVSGDQSKRRTRLFPASQVPNTTNVGDWEKIIDQQVDLFPFPLGNSLLFAEAANWCMLDQRIMESLQDLVNLQVSYYEEKSTFPKSMDSRQKTYQLKELFVKKTEDFRTHLALSVINTLRFVLE